MIKTVFRWLFSEPAPLHSEIELRNAIIAELYAHLEHIGHPVEAVRVPHFAIPAPPCRVHDAASVVVAVEHVFETEYGGFRLIAGLDAYGHNVVTGRSASATATSSTFGAPVGGDAIGVGTLAGWPALARPALAAPWFGRGEPWTGERASTRADRAAKLHEVGLEEEARSEHAQNLAAVLRAGDAAAVRQAEADTLAAMKLKGAK